MGWDLEEVGICAVNTILGDPDSPTINILTNHSELSLDTIREFEETYISTESRAAQDTFMIYKCIRNSLSTEAKRHIFIWKNDYTVDGKPSGNLLYKVYCRESGMDTKATTMHICTILSNLDEYIQSQEDDILKFNNYVKT